MTKLTYAVRTHQGKVRENNEDNFYWNGEIRADINENQVCYHGAETAGTVLAAVCCNVGDSRVYWMCDGKFEQLSVDHSRVQQLVAMGLITKKEARTHKSRHVITQYLGIFEEEMVIEPAFTGEICLKDGDLFLLCSDGLTDMVTDGEIAEILRDGSPEEQTDRLVERALEHGGRDNVTVIVCQVEKKGVGAWLKELKKSLVH